MIRQLTLAALKLPPGDVPNVGSQSLLPVYSMTSAGWVCLARETNLQETELETVINDLWEGQYINPVRVVGFKTAEGWSSRRWKAASLLGVLRSAQKSDRTSLDSFDRWDKVALILRKLKTGQGRN